MNTVKSIAISDTTMNNTTKKLKQPNRKSKPSLDPGISPTMKNLEFFLQEELKNRFNVNVCVIEEFRA
jgi:hypothetical protein